MKMMFLIIVVTLVNVAAFAQRKSAHVVTGNKYYKGKKFDKALTEYQQAANVNAADPVVSYNLGDAYFRNTKFDDAEKSFSSSIDNTSDNALKQKGYYNKGVSLSKQNKLEESIEAYKMAIRMNPADNDARINLQKALLELKKKMPPPPPKKEEKKKKPQENKPKNNESKLSRKEVEQRLKALQEREQQVQRKMQQRNRTAGRQEKDW